MWDKSGRVWQPLKNVYKVCLWSVRSRYESHPHPLDLRVCKQCLMNVTECRKIYVKYDVATKLQKFHFTQLFNITFFTKQIKSSFTRRCYLKHFYVFEDSESIKTAQRNLVLKTTEFINNFSLLLNCIRVKLSQCSYCKNPTETDINVS